MAQSFTDALLKAGVVRPEDTPDARREREWRERQRREAAEAEERLADSRPLAQWEKPAQGQIVESRRVVAQRPSAICAECGDPFDPSAPEHKTVGRNDQCGPCARGETPGPRRKRGQMVWTHKTAPTLEIEGGRPLGPEELAAMRRR